MNSDGPQSDDLMMRLAWPQTGADIDRPMDDRDQLSDDLRKILDRFGTRVEGVLQERMDTLARAVAEVRAEVDQAGVNTEAAIVAALDDILTRLERDGRRAAEERQQTVKALAKLSEQVESLRRRLPLRATPAPAELDEAAATRPIRAKDAPGRGLAGPAARKPPPGLAPATARGRGRGR